MANCCHFLAEGNGLLSVCFWRLVLMTVEPDLTANPGVRVDVAHDGLVVALSIDPELCRTASAADLGVAIVLAHRRARAALIEGQRQEIRDVLAEWGIDESAGTWTA
jgi:hypothetical protein